MADDRWDRGVFLVVARLSAGSLAGIACWFRADKRFPSGSLTQQPATAVHGLTVARERRACFMNDGVKRKVRVGRQGAIDDDVLDFDTLLFGTSVQRQCQILILSAERQKHLWLVWKLYK